MTNGSRGGSAGPWLSWPLLTLCVVGCGASSEESTSSRSSNEGDPTSESGDSDDSDSDDGDSDDGESESEDVDPPEPVECAGNLLEKDLGPKHNWIGGEPDTDVDDPCGIQGPIYVYGDTETASAAGLPPSCTIPADEDATISCAGARCCISGTTVEDRDYAAWGCGIGVGLRHTAGRERLPYSELGIVGFRFAVEGTLSEGQYLRVHFEQPGAVDNSCAPFLGGSSWTGSPIHMAVLAQGPFRGEARFDEVACPADTGAECGCIPPGPAPLDLQFQVTGGVAAGPYEFCVTELSVLTE